MPETKRTVENTEVTINVWEGKNRAGIPGIGVTVDVRCLPGYSYWKCPDSRTLRRMVDKALKETGYRRDGSRLELQAFPNWRFRYFTTPDNR